MHAQKGDLTHVPPCVEQVVKGSGKAADLLADVVILTDVNGKGDSEPKDQTQFQLNDVLQSLVISSEDAVDRYDIFEAIDTLKNWEHSDIETDIQRSTDVKLRSLMTESYSIVMKGAGNGTTKHLYKYLRETLEAVSTGLVFVFDLKEASSDFNGALLKALMSSFERSDFAGKSLHEKAWYKLKYTMLWGRDDLVHEQLEEVLLLKSHFSIACVRLYVRIASRSTFYFTIHIMALHHILKGLFSVT